MLNDTAIGFITRWMKERELIVADFKNTYPSRPVPDQLFIHEWQGELKGYSEYGAGRIVRMFKGQMEQTYGRTFDFSNHTMRRTFGRRQWQLGTPIETISEILGHESIDMTRKYLGLDLSDQIDPMKAQDRLIQSVLQNSEKAGHFSPPASEIKWAQRDFVIPWNLAHIENARENTV